MCWLAWGYNSGWGKQLTGRAIINLTRQAYETATESLEKLPIYQVVRKAVCCVHTQQRLDRALTIYLSLSEHDILYTCREDMRKHGRKVKAFLNSQTDPLAKDGRSQSNSKSLSTTYYH